MKKNWKLTCLIIVTLTVGIFWGLVCCCSTASAPAANAETLMTPSPEPTEYIDEVVMTPPRLHGSYYYYKYMTPEPTPEPTETPKPFDAEAYVDEHYYYEIKMLARTVYLEARGIESRTEQACVIWTILNRATNRNMEIKDVITAPNQFAYRSNAPMVDDRGVDLRELARDVLIRWEREKHGEENVGRCLPPSWEFFAGHKDGHNYFRETYRSREYWDYRWGSPYED